MIYHIKSCNAFEVTATDQLITMKNVLFVDFSAKFGGTLTKRGLQDVFS